jgi:hypothetical protein
MSRLSPAMAGSLMGAVWFGLLVSAQWLVLRRLSPARRARILFLGYGASVIGVVVTLGLLVGAPGRPLGLAFGVTTLSCLFVVYGPLYYVVSHSLSVQSIILLRDHRGRLPRETLYETFAGRGLLRGRLETLVRSGYVVEERGTFRITPRGRRVIAPFRVVASLWKLGPGG